MFQSKYFTREQLHQAVPSHDPKFWQELAGRLDPEAVCFPVQYFCDLPNSELIRCRVILNFTGGTVLLDITRKLFGELALLPEHGSGIEKSRTTLVYLMSLKEE